MMKNAEGIDWIASLYAHLNNLQLLLVVCDKRCIDFFIVENIFYIAFMAILAICKWRKKQKKWVFFYLFMVFCGVCLEACCIYLSRIDFALP